MTLKEQVIADMSGAMKATDAALTSTLRMCWSQPCRTGIAVRPWAVNRGRVILSHP